MTSRDVTRKKLRHHIGSKKGQGFAERPVSNRVDEAQCFQRTTTSRSVVLVTARARLSAPPAEELDTDTNSGFPGLSLADSPAPPTLALSQPGGRFPPVLSVLLRAGSGLWCRQGRHKTRPTVSGVAPAGWELGPPPTARPSPERAPSLVGPHKPGRTGTGRAPPRARARRHHVRLLRRLGAQRRGRERAPPLRPHAPVVSC